MNDDKTLEQKVDELRSEPITAKDKAVGLLIAVVLLALCIGVWMKPDLIGVDSSDFTGRGGRKITRILNIIWSRPTGTVAGVFGLIIGWGALTKKVGSKPSSDSK
jgi:C4-dicarboxylate transporter